MRVSSLLSAWFVIVGCARAQPATDKTRVHDIGDGPAPRLQLEDAELEDVDLKDDSGAPAPARPQTRIQRIDVLVERAGLARALADARVDTAALAALDAAFATRLDLFAVATEGKTVTLWLNEQGSLIGAEFAVGSSRITAARYQGRLAPHGFYDERGLSLSGPLRARPVALSRVTSRFGERFDPIGPINPNNPSAGSTSVHHGVDYAVPIGTAVLAAGAGRIKARGTSKSAGNYLKLAHAGGFESLYLHLDRFEPGIEVGTRVAQNDVIARSGNTGRSTGPHVHYELRLAGVALDPERTMPIPDAALGSLALRQHREFIQQLQHLRGNQTAAQQGEVIR